MASLQCSNCRFGIHYHDIPDGTELILFSLDEWERLTSSNLLTCDYTLDDSTHYLEIWRCKKCGALMLFLNGSVNVLSSYKKCAKSIDSIDSSGEKYIVFEDTVWDQITEPEITGNEIELNFPDFNSIYSTINDNYLFMYDNNKFDTPVEIYEKINN